MVKEKIFDECIKEAILVSRKYMPKERSRINPKCKESPFIEEFNLACMLYVRRCLLKYKDRKEVNKDG